MVVQGLYRPCMATRPGSAVSVQRLKSMLLGHARTSSLTEGRERGRRVGEVGREIGREREGGGRGGERKTEREEREGVGEREEREKGEKD